MKVLGRSTSYTSRGSTNQDEPLDHNHHQDNNKQKNAKGNNNTYTTPTSPTNASHTSDVEMTSLDLQFQTNGLSLPTPEDFGITSGRAEKKRRRQKVIWIAGGVVGAVLAIGAIVGTAVGVTQGKKKQEAQVRSADNRVVAANAPAVDAIVNWLAERDISNPTDMTTPGTPQYRAVQWLRTRDDAALPVGDGNLNYFQSLDLAAYKYAASYVLSVLFFATGGTEHWGTSLDFLDQDDVCEWTDVRMAMTTGGLEDEQAGVLCDPRTLIPYTLDIELNNMTGSLPSELGILTSLEVLDLSYNTYLGGELPFELCQLTNLKRIEIGHTAFSGNLPSCLPTALTDLRELIAPEAGLSGPFPDLCEMSKLQLVVLMKNQFTGALPTCNWPELTFLGLSDNLFEGTLPTQLVNMASLTSLFLDGNELSGNPIGVLNQLVNIKELYLEGNSFTGDLTGTFAANLLSLVDLDLSDNAFTSTDGIPSQFFKLPNLLLLDLARNKLAGKISDTIPNMGSPIAFLAAYQNQITGTVPTSLVNLQNLRHVDLSNNRLTGDLTGHGVFTIASVENIFLAENPFLNGTVPAMIGMANLRELSLKGTNRIGTLPTFADSPFIHLIDLDNNALTGTVPANYGTFTNLGFLLVNRNPGLNGDIPTFTKTLFLHTVLLDGTGLTGDAGSLCNLPVFRGEHPPLYDTAPVVVLADCADSESSSGITNCPCCRCCTKGQGVCSQPTVDSMDWTWEYKFNNFARDFGLNETNLPPGQTG